jgi:hypothetical protein
MKRITIRTSQHYHRGSGQLDSIRNGGRRGERSVSTRRDDPPVPGDYRVRGARRSASAKLWLDLRQSDRGDGSTAVRARSRRALSIGRTKQPSPAGVKDDCKVVLPTARGCVRCNGDWLVIHAPARTTLEFVRY